jgi:hypothetical protein
MDGTHECIPSRLPGQLFFQVFFLLKAGSGASRFGVPIPFIVNHLMYIKVINLAVGCRKARIQLKGGESRR